MIEGVIMRNTTKQFKKGVLELAILKLLIESDQYGYAIVKMIHERSMGKLTIKEGTLYPILYRLEDNNLIESYWSESSDTRGKQRKYYRITKQGRQKFKDMYQDFLQVFDGIRLIVKEANENE